MGDELVSDLGTSGQDAVTIVEQDDIVRLMLPGCDHSKTRLSNATTVGATRRGSVNQPRWSTATTAAGGAAVLSS